MKKSIQLHPCLVSFFLCVYKIHVGERESPEEVSGKVGWNGDGLVILDGSWSFFLFYYYTARGSCFPHHRLTCRPMSNEDREANEI